MIPAAPANSPLIHVPFSSRRSTEIDHRLIRFHERSRCASGAESQLISAEAVGDRTDDRYWLLGVFYFKRDDPAVLVEKRFGIGYTVNFARPMSWTIFLVLALLVALVRILH